MTVPRFIRMKEEGAKITMVTAYDYGTAMILDEAGVDAILVGDSLAMVVQGEETTLPVTVDEMIYHARMVTRGTRRALVVVDMPFPSNHLGTHEAIRIAAKILKESHAQAVKLEGGADQADVISSLTNAGIPVMAHVGLRPQTILQMGNYRLETDEQGLLRDALAAQRAGAFSMVLECMPAAIARNISEQIRIPTIGIGAGPDCDGQVLVYHDLVGLTPGRIPKHVKTYAQGRDLFVKAVRTYCEEVREQKFPGEKQSS
jgi:3-methyl-2-oxobutanoate hydroxymethyltransferase